MADADRNIIELIVQGAEQSVRRIETVIQSQTQLATIIESTGVRQRTVYDSVSQAAERAAIAEEKAAKRAETAARVSAEARIAALQRVRDEMGRFLSEQQVFERQLARATQAAGQLNDPKRLQAAVGASQFTARREAILAEQQNAAINRGASILTPGQLQDQLGLARQAAQFTAARNAALAQAAAAQTLQGRLQALGQTITGVVASTLNLVRGSGQSTAALNAQANAASNASRHSITYLSVLSAIHAASFLATNQTFSMLGSFITLGAAFGKVSLAGAGVGLALGAILGIFGQISQAAAQLQQAFIGIVTTAAGVGTGIAAAGVAAGVAATKIAGDVESQLASVRAFGGATNEQLRIVEEQASQLSIQFGVAAADVVQASSLFARAGGTIAEAIGGATEAIIKLQVASQGEITAAQAAIAVSAAIKQFSLEASDASRAVDVLTAAAQGSALSFAGVQQAFVQAAPGAKALGITIEDLGTAIALIGDQLVKGTITGTAFKQAILDLINPTKQAQAIYDQYGVTIKDTNGNMLPLIDIVESLNRAFGAMVDEQGNVIKQQDAATLAAIGGARAFLAFNILTEAGANKFQEYRDALDKVSASDIVSVLLLPMNKQLERLQQAISETARGFGANFLGPVRDSVSQAVDVIAGLIPAATLAGQAVATVLTGQGFGALQVAIDRLAGGGALSSFFIELVNSARNVREVIVGQIIPALQDFIGKILAIPTGNMDEIANGFDNLNSVIAGVGAVVTTAIRNLASLTAEMITGTGIGGRLRETIEALAKAILVNLAASLTTAVVTMQAAIVALPILARFALLTAEAVLKLAGALKELALKSVDITQAGAKLSLGVGNPLDVDEQRKLQDTRNEIDRQANLQREILARDTEQAQALAAAIPGLIGNLDNLSATFQNIGKTDTDALATARKSVEQIANELIAASGIDVDLLTQDDVNEFIQRAGAIREGARQQLGGIVTVVDDLTGDLPSQFANLFAEIEQAQKEARERAAGGTPAPQKTDTIGIDRARERIAEAARDVSRRLANLSEDAEQKIINNGTRALERLGDIFQNARDRIADLQEQTDDRIKDLFRGIAERREDRGQLEALRERQEKELRVLQERHDVQDRLEQRALDRIRSRNQQATEDYERSVEQQFEDTETLRQRQIDAAQRAFDQIQQIQETAFDRAQDAEATAFQRAQQAAAEARTFGLSLAEAKTPEDRANLLKQRQRALQDTKFQQGQEDALTKFRQQQEEKKRKFQQAQELAAIGFRQGQETSFTQFRRRQEENLLAFRRDQERIARNIREAEEDTITIPNRQRREREMLEFRKQLEKEFQEEQDKIEDKRAVEQKARIIAEATKEANKILANAEKQAGEVIDQLILQNEEQAADLDKQLRNIQDTLRDLGDSVPPEVLGNLLTAQIEAQQRADQIRATLAELRAGNLLKVQQAAAVGVADLITRVRPGETPTDLAIPAQVLAVQTLQVASMVVPPELLRGVGLEFLSAFRQASSEGLFPSEINVDLTEIEEGVQSMRRFFTGRG